MRDPLQHLLAKGWAHFRRLAERETWLTGPRVGGGDDASSDLLYARGFLLCRSDEIPGPVRSWTHEEVGGWNLYVDPRVPLQQSTKAGQQVIVIGDAFHAGSGTFTDIAEWLVEGDLLRKVDGMGGRFLLLHRQGARIDIYNDALGSRSVFYGSDVVASHSDLAATIIGTGLRDWVIPFITSRGYIHRDVKYLPGLHSPFDGVEQLTPNCRLRLGSNRPERYWPREELKSTEPDQALRVLTDHLKALRQYFIVNKLRPVVGLSAGRDSRGVIAALAELNPSVFTFVRSESGESTDSTDSRIATQIVENLGLDLEILRVKAPPQLDDLLTPFAAAFRRNTGYVRGNNSSWVEQYSGKHSEFVFVRGFGGEVMRGFYPELHSISPKSLAHLYDVNAGSRASQDAFAHFIDQASWKAECLFNHPLEGQFYWEHRMGIWGASALSESDMAFRGIPGYNSRKLFEVFAGLGNDVNRRQLFEAASAELQPAIGSIPYSS